MKKILLLIIPALLIISGCGNQGNNDVTNVDKSNPENQMLETQQEINEIVNDNTSQDYEVKSTKQDCMAGCEIMWKSNTLNKDRSPQDMAQDCNSLCDAAQGMQNNDISECEKAQGMMRDSCFTDIAQDLNQPEICGKITEPMLRNGCFTSLAEENKDLSICDNITDKMWKGICIENVQNKEE